MHPKPMKKLFLILICLMLNYLSVIADDQASRKWIDRYNFTEITINEGLPHNFVDDIKKDSRGFLWIATSGGGIARYDGREFTSFNFSSQHSVLKGNFIIKCFEDNFNRMWLIGEQGIDMIDIYGLMPVNVTDKSNKLSKLCLTPSHYIYKDSKGNIWIASENKLFKIVFNNSGEVVSIIDICNVTPGQSITSLLEVDNYIWLNYYNEVRRVPIETNRNITPMVISKQLTFPSDTYILAMYNKDNEIWIGSNSGLYRYSLATEKIHHYTNNPLFTNTISQNFITDITETNNHTLIISTLKGINFYDPLSNSFERIGMDSEERGISLNASKTLNSDFVNCMLTDNDIIWIGTETGGLNQMTPRDLEMINYSHRKNSPTSLSKNLVNAIYKESNGTLWVGTVEGGLNRKDPDKDDFTHYTTTSPARLSHNSISALASDKQGHLWIGTWGGGLGWLDMKSPKQFNHITNGTELFDNGFVGVVEYDNVNNLIWIGTNHDIIVYDIKNKRVFDPFKGKRKEIINGSIGACIDNKQQLWLGTAAGLYQIKLKSFASGNLEYNLYKYKLDDPSSRLLEKVTSVCQSRDGSIWVGSNGYGIYRSTGEKNGKYQFKSYSTDNGLVNNGVRGIVEDNYGNIWITTSNGLSCFNPSKESFRNFTEKDGFLSNQFYWNAAERDQQGMLYFGSLNGLTIIKPNPNLTINKEVPLVYTHLKVQNEERTLEDGIFNLHESNRNISIEFASLNFNTKDGAIYSYRLLGFDDKWVNGNKNRNFVTYANLPSGKYTFELRYAPDGIHWQKEVLRIPIDVSPYFYKTIWFILLMIGLIAFVTYRYLSWRVKEFKKQQEILHEKVKERTLELEKQKSILRGQATELTQQNALLKEQNEKITHQKTQIMEMSKKVQELTVDKLSFFTNITHEFRTPLTLIIGPIERALKLSYNPQVIEQLHFVERNSRYLLSLVNQLMDFRKVESDKMEISLNAGNFTQFITEVMTPFKAYAHDREIELECNIRMPQTEILFDSDAMQKVIVNIVANAFKFTPKGGKISIIASSYIHNNDHKILLAVKDTGTGIPQKDLEKIFERFYQSQKSMEASLAGQSGTGIGLYLSHKIIKLLNGEIHARNNRTKGSSFIITIPLIITEKDSQQELQSTHNEINRRPAMLNNKMTILVVEDNKDMRDYIRSILEEYYNVEEASQGNEALSVLKTRNIDFIISDLMMPVMDGLELSRQVKANFALSHIPFLMLTAKTSNDTKIESYKIGVDDYLLKPFDDQLLLARISNIIENRKRYQQRFSVHMDTSELNIDEESSDKKFMNRALQIVKDNYKNANYEVSDFIDEIGISKSLLNKKMQSITGQSTGQFMRSYRLNIARELIIKNRITHNMNISEIAFEVGFNDPKYFTRCFTKHFGVTPSSLLESEN